MTLKLLIDEDSWAKILVNLLLQAGHNVLTVNKTNLSGKSVAKPCRQAYRLVFHYACSKKRSILTRNYDDFQALHQDYPIHSGILVIYGNANSWKDMRYRDIVKAIANLETANFPLASQFIALNHWNY